MRVLPDECVPKRFQNSIRGHDCWTAPQAGLTGKKNGELLEIAEHNRFDVLLTVDKAIPQQQNFTGRRISVVIIRARSKELEDLLPYVSAFLAAIKSIQPGEIVYVGFES
jgi:hypothetical protein